MPLVNSSSVINLDCHKGGTYGTCALSRPGYGDARPNHDLFRLLVVEGWKRMCGSILQFDL